MCDPSPGPLCAADTRARAACACDAYAAAYPDGPAVDPLTVVVEEAGR